MLNHGTEPVLCSLVRSITRLGWQATVPPKHSAGPGGFQSTTRLFAIPRLRCCLTAPRLDCVNAAQVLVDS